MRIVDRCDNPGTCEHANGEKNENKIYHGKTYQLTFILPRKLLVLRVRLQCGVDDRQK